MQLESYFGSELGRHILDNPDLLRGRDTPVTILFCDLRKFSTNSEHLGPEATVEWIGQVMGAMSDCVARHGGIVVDYIGDEIMAMSARRPINPTTPSAPARPHLKCSTICLP